MLLSPEIEIANQFKEKLEAPGALDNVPFAKIKLRLLEILVEK